MKEDRKLSHSEAKQRVERNDWRPRNAVWELTLACNLRCKHCGSRAGLARPDEMSKEECLGVADQLADLGCELLTLSGGEPTLHPAWREIGERLVRRNVRVNMVTNGVYGTEAAAREIGRGARDSGFSNVGISIDGPEVIHETIRGRGTYAKTLSSIQEFKKAGLSVGVLTTVNKLNFDYLEQIRQTAVELEANMWRLQLAKPMGTMKDNDRWVLSPVEYLQLVPRLARLKRQGRIHLAVGDSIGYYGPHDRVLRGWGWRGRQESWQGCQAGMQAIGIEANGGIKGCLLLQAKWGEDDPFVEGNVRVTPLADLWHSPGVFAFNRDFDPESLHGHCAACKHGRACRGGARCVASAFLGHLHEDPYCYHRLAELVGVEAPGLGLAQSAAAAAAAVMFSIGGFAACDKGDDKDKDKDKKTDTVGQKDGKGSEEFCCPEYGMPLDQTPGPDVQIEYGIPPDVVQPKPDVQIEYGIPPDVVQPKPDVQIEYGIPPDVVQPKPDVQLEYGMPVDVVEPEVQMDYGIPPDVSPPPDAQDVVDCDAVCCMCEYGIIPEEVYKQCCEKAPDPCEGACCECDYGEPPPPECCPPPK
jgi:MoaA/NifB/PqqE/SkfB family radical SAM enzyme